MTTDPGPTASGPSRQAHGRRYKRREVALPDGGRLALAVDGSITQHDADGAVACTWTTDDPEWASRAIRFGLRPQEATVSPTSRGNAGTYPPRR